MKIKLPEIKIRKLLNYWKMKGFEVSRLINGRIYIKKAGG